MTRIKSLLKNNNGVAWYMLFITLLLTALSILLVVFSFSKICVGIFNVKDKVKIEMNNTAAAASEMIHDDIAENNFSSYIMSFNEHENELHDDFIKRLKKTLYFKTSDYEISSDSVNLTFEKSDNYITYIFQCRITIYFQLYEKTVPIISEKDICIKAKHYFKNLDKNINTTDYHYNPENKTEHSIER